jgi:flagellar hook-length control protein FliK
MKTSTSRHDPSARLEGKVPADSSTPQHASENMERGGPRATGEARAGTAKVASITSTTSNSNPSAISPGTGAATAALQAASGVVTRQPGSASGASKVDVSVVADARTATRQVVGGAGQAGGRGAQNQGAATPGTNAQAGAKAAGPGGVRGFELTLQKSRAKPSAQAPSSRAPEKPVPEQAVRGLAAVLRQKGGNVTLRLAPDSLGDLRISMKLDGAQVWASIEATNEPARQLLEEQRDTLREALEAHGLKVERLDVSAAKLEAGRTGVKDHATTPTLQDSPRPDGSVSTGEDRRGAEGWSRTLQGSIPGGSAEGSGEDAGGAGEMLLTVRGAPVNVWAEAQGTSMRLRVDAVA